MVAALRPSASDTPSFPPQQSPMFGHRASSQTVWRPRPRRSFLIFAKEEPLGMLVFRNDGSRGLRKLLAQRENEGGGISRSTYAFVFPRTTRSGTLSAIKSSSDGPSSSVSLKFGLDEEGVARHRTCGRTARATRTAHDTLEAARDMLESCSSRGRRDSTLGGVDVVERKP